MKQADVLRRIERHLKASHESPSAFGKRAVGDANLVFQLRAEPPRSLTMKTVEKILAAIPTRPRPPVHSNSAPESESPRRVRRAA